MSIATLSGLAALQVSRQGIQGAATRIASATTGNEQQPAELTDSLLTLKEHARQAEASVEIIRTEDEILGTLLDISG